MSDDGILTLHAATRPILVASRLRTSMEQRGFAALDRGAPKHPQEVGVVVRKGPAGMTWIHPEFADAIPDELGQKLSHDLRCRVTSVIRSGEITAYEAAEGGAVIEKLAVNGDEILEDTGTALGTRVRGGESLRDLLDELGLSEIDVGYRAALEARGRKMPLRFAPLPGRAGAGGELEIDPLLECPNCKSPMQTQQGRYGDFYGCVRFPMCRGRYTAKQADAAREARGG